MDNEGAKDLLNYWSVGRRAEGEWNTGNKVGSIIRE
jgi:hypothetical protein